MVLYKMFSKTFVFQTDGKVNTDSRAIEVAGGKLYDTKTGYGFVVEENRRKDEWLQMPELNAGFDVPYWYRDETVTAISMDSKGYFVDSAAIIDRIDAKKGRLVPLCFKADVNRLGNYEVSLKLYAKGEVIVFAGPRRLVYKNNLEKKQEILCTFVLNVCDIIPRGKTCLWERRCVDVALLGEDVHLQEMKIKQVNCPTLYIAGDSTVTDQSAEYPYAPGTSYAGWGQMISAYLPKGIAVSNHAHSGLTVESFRSEGHYAIIQSNIKPGDYLMMQFAHNDQKLMHLKARGGYQVGIVEYIEETRQRGAHPIIITPLARNSWKANDGSYNDLLEEYADVCLEIGKRYKVPVIDLHGMSKGFVLEKGLEASKSYFFPKDFTHSNDYGAYMMAGFIAEALKSVMNRSGMEIYARLVRCVELREDEWIPNDDLEVQEVPQAYRNIPNPNGDMTLFADLDRPTEPLVRVDALDMVIKSARFFPTNVFNDTYDDIVGHEWYAGTVECAYQNGIILPQMIHNNRFEPDKKVTLEEFLVFIMSGYRSRKNLPEESACELDEMSTVYCMPYVRAAYKLGVVHADDDLKAWVTRERAAEICRELKI